MAPTPFPTFAREGEKLGSSWGTRLHAGGKLRWGERVVTIAGKRRNESLELWGTKVPVVERKEHKHN